MPDKSWKARERKIAHFFGGERNSLSGANSKVCSGDVIHENLSIEVKLRKRHSAVKLWDKTKALADKEGKLPVVALAEKNRPGFWILVHSDDLVAVTGAHKWALADGLWDQEREKALKAKEAGWPPGECDQDDGPCQCLAREPKNEERK